MKEYTVIAVISVILAVIVDRVLNVNLLLKPGFYSFLLIIALFKLMVNGYLTGADIVMYDPRFFLGIRIGSIPVEDFLFGFSMVTLSIDLWERYKMRNR